MAGDASFFRRGCCGLSEPVMEFPAVLGLFGPFRLRLAPCGSVWLRLAPFRVCFGSISGPFRGVGWGRGGVGERGFCKGKECH